MNTRPNKKVLTGKIKKDKSISDENQGLKRINKITNVKLVKIVDKYLNSLTRGLEFKLFE